MHTTEQLNAALAGRYAIEREIGAGGMATVYLAQDVRHRRRVALKVLKPDLGAVVGVERFLSEIQVTANLQHPNLLPLFDSGEANGLLFYVMPYVEGESLRARLDREKQLPVDAAVHIATAVAGALDYAHRHGVIHRDLKPENILMHDGEPLVADFGIALAVSNAGGNRITQTGLSLGTPQYMSPEQATGDRTVDARTDVYSLGAVTYEMLTGEAPHTGTTSQAIIARVLTEKPRSIRVTRPSVPQHIEYAVEHALEKLPADRWATAKEFSDTLTALRPLTTAAITSVAPAAASSRRPGARAMVLVTAAIVVGAAIGYTARGATDGVARAPAVYDVGLPDSAPISFTGGSPWGEGWTALDISPAGDFVVYVAARGDDTELWYRSLVDTIARPITGTRGAYHPMLSPDARQVAFFSRRNLVVVSTDGGAPLIVGEVDRPRGGQWSTPDQILVADSNGTRLRGYDPVARRASRFAFGCRSPRLLPDGAILCGARGAVARWVTPGRDSTAQPLLIGTSGRDTAADRLNGSQFELVGSHLVYMAADGSISATRVDLPSRRAGRPVSLVAGVRREGFDAPGQFAVAPSGALAFAPGDNVEVAGFAKLREGRSPEPLPIPAAAHHRFDVSRDGRRLVSALYALSGMELWVYDVATGRGERWMRAEDFSEPRWSPSGERVVVRVRASDRAFHTVIGEPGSRTPPETLFTGGTHFQPSSFYADSMLIGSLTANGRARSVRLDLRTRPVRVDTLTSAGGVSPDGRWQSVQTTRGGGFDIYVQRFPADGRQYHASPNGGLEALWVGPGLLRFRSGTSWYEVTVGGSGPNPVSEPRLFASDPRFIDTYDRSNALMPDGSAVYVRGSGRATASFLRVIPRFVEEMRRRVR